MQGKKEGLAIRVAKPVIDYLKKKTTKKKYFSNLCQQKVFFKAIKTIHLF